jgi:hypothetical protein
MGFWMIVFACSSSQSGNKPKPDVDLSRFVLIDELKNIDSEAYEEIYPVYKEIAEDQRQCVLEWAKKKELNSPDFRKDLQRHQWEIYMTVSSRAGVGKFTGGFVDENFKWPEYFNEEVKSCYLNSIEGVSFESAKDYEYRISSKTCVYPDPEK